MKSEPGYPKSILRDFMGCNVDLDPDRDTDVDPGRKWPDRPPFNPDAGRDKDKEKEKDKEKGKDKDKEQDRTNDVDTKEATEEGTNEVDVVLKIDETERTMKIIMVTVPLILVLCILALIYAIINTLQRKGAPKYFLHCKRSLQDWV